MKKSMLHISRTHLHRRVLYQLIIFAIISVVMFILVGIDIFQGILSVTWALSSIILGGVVGILAGRMFAIKWHEDTQKVIIGIDKTGIFVIILYVAFRIYGRQILGEFLHGDTLTAFTFCMLGGIMLGRLFSMYQSIVKILKEQQIVE